MRETGWESLRDWIRERTSESLGDFMTEKELLRGRMSESL